MRLKYFLNFVQRIISYSNLKFLFSVFVYHVKIEKIIFDFFFLFSSFIEIVCVGDAPPSSIHLGYHIMGHDEKQTDGKLNFLLNHRKIFFRIGLELCAELSWHRASCLSEMDVFRFEL